MCFGHAVVLLFFVYPNTHTCLAFYPTRLEREKDKVEAFDLICLLNLRVLRSEVLIPI